MIKQIKVKTKGIVGQILI